MIVEYYFFVLQVKAVFLNLYLRALSSPKTPHQVLKQNPKTTQNIDNDDDITFTFMLLV